ncbi:MAG: hypothetical protein H0T71_08335 [Acidobacteria bacterium]|nr:hypothetical protein [Acidobacteriota bacterium]
MFEHPFVFITISAAVAAWALAELFDARWFWAAGAALALIHSAAAFHVFYDWSHNIALEQTTGQTAALTGVAFAGGIYINYLFLAVWMADAVWWLVGPVSYKRRPRGLSLAVRGFIFFIIVNGAVVFADGLARGFGVVAVGAVMLRKFKVQVLTSKSKVQQQGSDE